MTNAQVKLDFHGLDQLGKVLGGLAKEFHFKVLDAGLRAAGKVIRDRARQLAPDGVKSGTEAKMSKKAIAAGKKPEQHLKNLIYAELRRFDRGSIIYIGAAHPAGNQINFNFGKGRRRYYWDQTGVHRDVRGAKKKVYHSMARSDFKVYENFLKKAADETKSEYTAAFIRTCEEKARSLGWAA